MIVLSCRLVSSGSFVLTGLGFQVVVRLAGSVRRFDNFLLVGCALRGCISTLQSCASEYMAAIAIR